MNEIPEDKNEKGDLHATWHGFDLKLTPDGYLIVNDKYKVHISGAEASDEYPFESEEEMKGRIIFLLFSGVQISITVNIDESKDVIRINVENEAYDIFDICVPMIYVGVSDDALDICVSDDSFEIIDCDH